MVALSSKIARKAANGGRASALALAGIALCFVAWASLFVYRSSVVGIDGGRYFALFDDAMISMRYAWNFSHGYGLVWTRASTWRATPTPCGPS